jgi:hypothetical protein
MNKRASSIYHCENKNLLAMMSGKFCGKRQRMSIIVLKVSLKNENFLENESFSAWK